MEEILNTLSSPINQLITLGLLLVVYALAYSGRVMAGKRRTTKQQIPWSWKRFWNDLAFRLGVIYSLVTVIIVMDILSWILSSVEQPMAQAFADAISLVTNVGGILALPLLATLNEVQKTLKLQRTIWRYQENLQELGVSESDVNSLKIDTKAIADDFNKFLGALASSVNVQHDSVSVQAGKVLSKSEVKRLAEMGAIPYYKVDISTPKLAYENLAGKAFDEGFGIQCVAGFKEFMHSLSGRYVAAGGAAKNYAQAQIIQAVSALGFTWHRGTEGLQDGDWGIWESGTFGHVAMYYQGQWLGQNQGAIDGNAGNAFNLMALPMNGFVGYYRPNIYNKVAVDKIPEAETVPAPAAPQEKPDEDINVPVIQKGDRVAVIDHIDVNGTRLMNLQSDYLVFQTRKSDQTAVLKSDDGDIYARIAINNLRKV